MFECVCVKCIGLEFGRISIANQIASKQIDDRKKNRKQRKINKIINKTHCILKYMLGVSKVTWL